MRGPTRASHPCRRRRSRVATDEEGESPYARYIPACRFRRRTSAPYMPDGFTAACLPGMRAGVWEAGQERSARRRSGVCLSTTHEMTRTRVMGRGVEEWSCSRCGRRLLFRRQPAFEKVVLDRGDEGVTHVGGTGGLRVAAPRVAPAERDLPAPDRSWLAAQGIDWGPEETP